MEVLAPIQEGANKALKPLRDLFGWFGDTWDAKDERDALRKGSVTSCSHEVTKLQGADAENDELRGLLEYHPRTRASTPTRPSPPRSTRARTRPGTRRSRSTRARQQRRPRPARDQRRRPRRQGQVRVRRQRRGHAALRRRLRRLGAGAQRRPAGHRGLPITGSRNGLLFNLVPQAKKVREGDRRDHRGHDHQRPALAVPARHPDRDGAQGAGRGGARARRSTSSRPPTCAAWTSSGCSRSPPPTRWPPLDAMTTTWNAGAVARLFALGLAGAILQLTTVSQITVFGVPARTWAPLLAASVGLLLRLGRRGELRLRARPVHRHGAGPDAGDHVARAARRRLRRGPPVRAARPRPRPRARGGRRRGHRDRGDRLRHAAVPARRRRARLAAARAPGAAGDRAQHAARPAGPPRTAGGSLPSSCPTIRGVAAAAPTPRAA